MTKRRTRKASWLLTVASAYSVVPGCSDDPSQGKPHSSMASGDGGSTVAPAHKSDAAAATKDSGNAAGRSDELDAGEEELDFPTLIGVIIFPPDNDLPALDGGPLDTPPAEDAGRPPDADSPVGLVVLPPDASLGDQGPSSGPKAT